MGTERHRIRKETLRVEVDSEELALALQPRLRQLNLTVFHEILERVLDEFATPGQHVRLDTLQVDLGVIRAVDVEAVAAARLEAELREALRKAMRAIDIRPTPQQFVQSAGEARLDVLREYLVHGTVPFWIAASEFRLDQVIAEAAASDSDGLLRLLRQHGTTNQLLQRLVRQLDGDGLRRLMHLVSPVHAAPIISEIEELIVLVGPHVDGGDAGARRLVWELALAKQLRDGGAPHNRADFVRSLLAGLAGQAEVRYDELLKDVELDRAAATGRTPAGLPLTAVIEGLRGQAPHALALDARPSTMYDYADILGYYLRHGLVPWSAALDGVEPTVAAALDALPGFPFPLIHTVLSAGSPRERAGLLLRAVRDMSDQALARLLAALLGHVRPDVASSWAVIAERVKQMTGRASRGTDRDATYARILAGLLDGEIAEWEAFQASQVAPMPAEPGPVVWEAHRIKATLAARLRRGVGAVAGAPASSSLLHWLIEKHLADARHFLRALHRAGLRPSALLDEPGPPNLVEVSLGLLPPETAAALALLLRVLGAMPAAERPASGDQMRALTVRAVLDEAGVDVHDSEWFLVRVVRQWFGHAVPASTVVALQDAAARLMEVEGLAPDPARAVRTALASLGVGFSELVRPVGVADVVASDSAARAVPPAAMPADVPEATPVSQVLSAEDERADGTTGAAPHEPVRVESPMASWVSAASALEAPREQRTGEVGQVQRAGIAESVGLLRKVLAALPPADRPASDEELPEMMAQAVLGEDHVDAYDDEGVLVDLLRRLFGTTVPAGIRQALIEAAAQVIAREAVAAEPARLVRAALAALDAGQDDRPRTAGVADETPRELPESLAPPEAAHLGVRSAAPPPSGPAPLVAVPAPEAPAWPDARSVPGLEAIGQWLPAAVAESLGLLLQVLAALPASDRPGSEDQVRAALGRAVLDETGVGPHAGERLLVRVLQRLFGTTVLAGTHQALVEAAAQVIEGEAVGAESARLVRAALASLAVRHDDRPRTAGPADGTPRELPEGIAPPEAPHPGVRSMAPPPSGPAPLVALPAPEAPAWPDARFVPGLEAIGQRLPAAVAESLTLLISILAALPATLRPESDEQVRAVIASAVLDEAADEAHDTVRFLVRLLRQLYGPTVPVGARAALGAEAARLIAAAAPEPARRVRAALETLGLRGKETTPGLADLAPGRAPAESSIASELGSGASPEAAIAFARLRGTEPTSGAPPGSDGLSREARRQTLLSVMSAMPDAVRDVVTGQVTDPRARARWVRDLSEVELARITQLLEPRWPRALLEATELLFEAWREVAAGRRIGRADVWSYLLAFLAQTAVADRSLDRLVAAFVAYAGMQHLAEGTATSSERAMLGERVLHAAARLAQRAGHTSLRAVLLRGHPDLLQRWRVPTLPPPTARPRTPSGIEAPSPDRPQRRRMAFSMEEEADATSQPIHIANAGLVITGAFLPRLFESLEMLEQMEDGKRRVRPQSLSRGVHLLQYLASGRTDSPEPLLCLNKVLCGVALATPVDRAIEATPREREMCDLLLASVIANWTILKGTTVPGLQETFLQREGRLERTPTGWRLQVQRRTLDVLVDHIPWTVSTLALSWMPEPLFVTW